MEREENVFKNYNPTGQPMRDYTENVQVIEQGKVHPKASERIEQAEKGELKAKLAAILDRGIVQDRLHVELPSGIHGEWVRNDPLEIRRLEALGFRIDEEYAPSRAIHSDGSNSGIVGDVIHMICPKEVKETINQIRHERMLKIHNKTRRGKVDLNKEELEYLNETRRSGEGVTAYSSSSETVITPENISDILESIENQTTVKK